MKLSTFLSSRAGKKFYNFAYCWGACLVILGAVFKIAHMPFDSVLLMVGLFTEVFIFFISGFDTPRDDYKWERVFPVLADTDASPEAAFSAVEAAGESCRNQLKQMQQHIAQLNESYAEQIKVVRELSGQMKLEEFSEVRTQTREMSKLLNRINSAYGDQIGELKAFSAQIKPEKFTEAGKQTQEMSQLLEQLNEQYRQMLKALNVKN